MNLQLIDSIETWQSCRKSLQGSIGFVPTMGYLHAGHLSLVDKAKQECDIVVVSIYVNPSQFGANEDLSRYPRDLDRDLLLLDQAGVNYVITPSDSVMYPNGYKTWINVEQISNLYCGVSRPTHFRGVATIVAKLVNIVKPDWMYMGEKDFQQIVILEHMLRDLNFSTRICRCPLVREEDGLALSSRNVYLSQEERKQSLCLSQALNFAFQSCKSSQRDVSYLTDKMHSMIENMGGKVDYIAFVNSDDLSPVTTAIQGTRLLLAVYIGKTRLIDNLQMP